MANNFVSVNKLISRFHDFANAHGQVNYFFAGDYENLQKKASEKGILYPLLYVNFVKARVDDNQLIRTIDFFLLDKLDSESSNKNEVYSDSERILLDLKAYFERSEVYDDIEVELQNDIEKVKQNFNSDWVAGNVMTLNIITYYGGDICSIPNISIAGHSDDEFSETVSPVFITCQTLTGCSTIQTIQSDISTLYTLTGGTSGSTFDCNDLNNCSNFQTISANTYSNSNLISELSSTTQNHSTSISDLHSFSASTLEWQDLAAQVITEHTTDIEYLKQWTGTTTNRLSLLESATGSLIYTGATTLLSQARQLATVATSSSVAANTLYFLIFPIDKPFVCDQIGWQYVNSGLDWNVSIWSVNEINGKPDTRLWQGSSTPVGSAGIKTQSVNDLTLSGNVYVVFHCNSAINLYKYTSSYPILGISSTSYNTFVAGYTSSHSFASGFPSDTSALTLSELTGAPIVFTLRVKSLL